MTRSRDSRPTSAADQISAPRTSQKGVRVVSVHNIAKVGAKLQLLPDTTTDKLSDLKRVKFLDPEFEAPSRLDRQALSKEYMKKKQTMDAQLQKVINRTKVAHMKILKKSKEEIEREKKALEDEMARNPLAKLMATAGPNEEGPKEAEKFADGFVRSNRNVQLRVKQELLS